jgi:hypothetical protein
MKPDPTSPCGEQMAQLPAKVRWKADDDDHLMEQPTVSYPVALVRSLVSADPTIDAALAWTYVALRVLRALVDEILVDEVDARFVLVALSSLVLIAMIARAALALA